MGPPGGLQALPTRGSAAPGRMVPVTACRSLRKGLHSEGIGCALKSDSPQVEGVPTKAGDHCEAI